MNWRKTIVSVLFLFLAGLISSTVQAQGNDGEEFIKALQEVQKAAEEGRQMDLDSVYKAADKTMGTEGKAKSTYFETFDNGKYENLKTYNGDIQISSQCANAMVWYNEYRKAVSLNESQEKIDELYDRHVAAAKVAIAVYQQFSN